MDVSAQGQRWLGARGRHSACENCWLNPSQKCGRLGMPPVEEVGDCGGRDGVSLPTCTARLQSQLQRLAWHACASAVCGWHRNCTNMCDRILARMAMC